jgi:hypothetical protein
MEAIRTPALTFAVAALGVGAAWLGFATIWALPLVLLGVLAIIAFGLYKAGEARTRNNPVGAVKLMTWRLLGVILIAAGASALVIAISVWLKAPKGSSKDTEQLLTASVAALTALVSAVIIKDAEKADESWVAKSVKAVFEERFKGVFGPNTRGQRAVYEGTFEGKQGWGPDARRARAQAIAAELAQSSTR